MNKKMVKCVDLGKVYGALTLNREYIVESISADGYQVINDQGYLYCYPTECFAEIPVGASNIESLIAELKETKKNLKYLEAKLEEAKLEEAKLEKAKEKLKSKNVINLAILNGGYDARNHIDYICVCLADALGEPNLNIQVTSCGDLKEKSIYLGTTYNWSIIDNTYLVIEKK